MTICEGVMRKTVLPPSYFALFHFWLCFWNLRHLDIYHKPITSDKLCYFHNHSAYCDIQRSRQYQFYRLPCLITTIGNHKYLSISQNIRFLIEMLSIFPHSACSCFLTWRPIISAVFQPILPITSIHFAFEVGMECSGVVRPFKGYICIDFLYSSSLFRLFYFLYNTIGEGSRKATF